MKNKKVRLVIGKDSIIVWDVEKEEVERVFTVTDKSKYYQRMREILEESK